MSIIKEFKSFAMRGNVVDLAIGVIIGGAFGVIVTSLVGDVIMPVVGALTGGIDFSGLAKDFGSAHIAYGKFIQATFVFLIISFVLFLVVKGMNALKREEEKKEGQESIDAHVRLLTEIRDLLEKK